MLEVKVTIEAAELAAAINNLASAMGASAGASVAPAMRPMSAVAEQIPVPAPMAPMPAPMAPVASPAPAAVVSCPAPSVPLAAPPQYTVDQIMAAGATLMDSGKVMELMNLLHSFGVQAVMDLKPEQLGAFATAMRDLGARI